MGLGGTILAGVGIFVTVLVANGRWPAVWAAVLGTTPPPVPNAANANAPSVTGTGQTW